MVDMVDDVMVGKLPRQRLLRSPQGGEAKEEGNTRETNSVPLRKKNYTLSFMIIRQ